MAFENKTISEIYALLSTAMEQEFNKKFRLLPKSFLRILFKVFSGVFIICYKQIGWFFLQMFPETASWKTVSVQGNSIRPLVRLGVRVGIGEPFRATQWEGTGLVVVVNTDTALTAGTQLKSTVTGKVYLVVESLLLTEEIMSVSLLCAEAGTAGNLEEGDTLSFVNSSLGNVERIVTIETVTVTAVDAETESDYRSKVINRWKVQPQGGASADYRIWGSEVKGVLQIYVYKDPNSATGVLIYVSGDPDVYPDRIATTTLCKAVGEACTYDPNTGKATRKPMGAVLDPDGDESYRNVLSISVKGFIVYVTGVSGIEAADFADTAKILVSNHFLSLEPFIRGLSVDNEKANKVSKNTISGIINNSAISLNAEFEEVVIVQNGSTVTSYELLDGELAKLSGFYVNGVAF